MESLLLWVGRITALVGVLICAWSVYGRLTGTFVVSGFQVGTVLLAGITSLLVACVCFLLVLLERSRR
jgi:hypothetical protein